MDAECAATDESVELLVRSAIGQCRRGEVKAALARLQQGLKAARLATDRIGEIAILNAVALTHSIRGDFLASLAGGIDAFHMARSAGDRRGMAAATTTVAGAMILMSPAERELSLLEHAAAVAEDLNDFRLLIRVRNLLGIMMGDAGRFAEAEVHLDLALALTRCDRDAFDPARVNANIANLLRKRAQAARAAGQVAEAESLVRSGLELVTRAREESAHHGVTPMLLDILGIEGLLHNAAGRPADALHSFSEAWRLGQHCKLHTSLPFLGVEIARLELASGRLDSAETTLLQAMREATFYRPSPKAAALCRLLARVQKARGDGRGEQHWQREAAEAELAFAEFTQEIRRHLEDLAASWQAVLPPAVQAGRVGD